MALHKPLGQFAYKKHHDPKRRLGLEQHVAKHGVKHHSKGLFLMVIFIEKKYLTLVHRRR